MIMKSLGIEIYLIVLAVELCCHPEVVDCNQSKDKSISTVRFLKAIGSKFNDLKSDIKDIRNDLEQINRTCNINICEILWDVPEVISPDMKYAKYGVCSAITQIFNDVTSLKSNFTEKRKALEHRQDDMRKSLDKLSPKVENHDNVLKSLNNSFNNFTGSNKDELIKLKDRLTDMEKHLCALKECPSGWTKQCPSCYLFKSEALNWTEAVENCRMEGAYLVEYDRKDEVSFVLDLALSKKSAWRRVACKYDGFWVGGSDRMTEGEWTWSKSGRRIQSGFEYWYPGQPNDKKDQDCLTSLVNQDGRWNDGNCGKLKTFVCEKSLFSNN